MRIVVFIIAFFICSFFIYGQQRKDSSKVQLPKNYISFNPLNIIFFQQIGLTYEYKPGPLGYGITAGYIYPNEKEYSNWFIAGPVKYGSLGYYSGFFLVPQLNMYFSKPKKATNVTMAYWSVKGVYKFMTIDSLYSYAWDTHADDYYWVYRKQVDRVNIIGAFAVVGLKHVWKYFFFDLNFGPGFMFVNHNLVIAGETYGLGYHSDVSNIHPPLTDTQNEFHVTVNFSLNLGVPF